MNKRELDDLRELHMEFVASTLYTGINHDSLSQFFGWIYKQLSTRVDAEMTGFRKGREYAKEENATTTTLR